MNGLLLYGLILLLKLASAASFYGNNDSVVFGENYEVDPFEFFSFVHDDGNIFNPFVFEDFTLLETLGDGETAISHRAIHNPSKRQVVLKIFCQEHPVENIDSEEKLNRLFKHQNIVKFLGSMKSDEGNTVFVYEYNEGKDLQQILSANDYSTTAQKDLVQMIKYNDFIMMEAHEAKQAAKPPKRFSIDIVAKAAFDIINALNCIHSQGYVYNDLKLENIVLENNGEFILIDVGWTRPAHKPLDGGGLDMFSAPEVLVGKNVDYLADVYSLGLSLYMMGEGLFPYFLEDLGDDDESDDYDASEIKQVRARWGFALLNGTLAVPKCESDELQEIVSAFTHPSRMKRAGLISRLHEMKIFKRLNLSKEELQNLRFQGHPRL